MYNTKSIRIKRKIRIRKKIHGTANRPRLSVFRSNRYFAAQLIDDGVGKTIVGVGEKAVSQKDKKGQTKTRRAQLVGEVVAEKMKELRIASVVFDRNGYRYHGRIKAFADTLREKGITV